jgi:hypothetical protein
MKVIGISRIIMCLTLITGSFQAFGEETQGTISETGFHAFRLDEKGTTRLFNASSKITQYEPASWRPEVGDQVKVVYHVTQNKKGVTILQIDTTTLIKPGPNSVNDLQSPVTVTVVEVGKSGIKARIPKGQIVKFNYNRGKTEKEPAGWVEAVNDQALITFHRQPSRVTGKIGFIADKIEKIDR